MSITKLWTKCKANVISPKSFRVELEIVVLKDNTLSGLITVYNLMLDNM